MVKEKKVIVDIKKLEAFYKLKFEAILITHANIIGNPWAIDTLEEVLNLIEQECPTILQPAVNLVKDTIQKEAADVWNKNNQWGLLAMATGTGKSKIPIDILKGVCEHQDKLGKPYQLKILLIVPTEKLRDENWKEEFEKWEALYIYNSHIVRICYASLDNLYDTEWDLVIGDEFHNITEDKATFFKNNRVQRGIFLTATQPTDVAKVKILKELNIKAIYNVPLDIAVRLKLVAPYNITVVECRLDDIIKNVVGGTKAAPFMTTEKKAYDYKTLLVNQAMFGTGNIKKTLKFRILDRMRFIKNLESRTKNAKFILENFVRPDERTLIFAGGISQAEEICSHSFHSKTNDTYFEEFKAKLISWLSCVAALNEGHNIPDIETIFVVAIESGEKTITQQIGRGVRFAIGHNCRVIILTYVDTVDEKWLGTATAGFDQTKIRRIRMANLISGADKI